MAVLPSNLFSVKNCCFRAFFSPIPPLLLQCNKNPPPPPPLFVLQKPGKAVSPSLFSTPFIITPRLFKSLAFPKPFFPGRIILLKIPQCFFFTFSRIVEGPSPHLAPLRLVVFVWLCVPACYSSEDFMSVEGFLISFFSSLDYRKTPPFFKGRERRFPPPVVLYRFTPVLPNGFAGLSLQHFFCSILSFSPPPIFPLLFFFISSFFPAHEPPYFFFFSQLFFSFSQTLH